jgi:hypothetical protein
MTAAVSFVGVCVLRWYKLDFSQKRKFNTATKIFSTLKNDIDYPKRLGTCSTIKPKYLNQMINIVREEQKIACLKRSDQLH